MKANDLEAIRTDPGLDMEAKFNKMVLDWLKTAEPHTWSIICEAVKHCTVNMPDVATAIMEEYVPKEFHAGLSGML